MSRREPNLTVEQWLQLQRQIASRDRGDGGVSLDMEPPRKPPTRSQVRKGSRMNSWEREYAMELEARRAAGEILWWGYEAFKLRLTDNTFYTPDFAAIILVPWTTPEGAVVPGWPKNPVLTFIEVKGFLRDDANVKFKMAAELFPFEFYMYRKRRQRDGGGWELMKHLNGGGV